MEKLPLTRAVRLVALLTLFVAVGTAHCRELFRVSDLVGLTVAHTEFGKRPSDGPGFLLLNDKISGEILISVEKRGDDEEHYIEHNGGKHRIFPLRGKASITFIESYGGNTFLWTVCLEEKNEDGSRMVIMSANLADGLIGIRSKIFRGKAKVFE